MVLTACIPVRPDGLGRAGQVEDDQLGLVGLAHDDLVQADRRVHATDVGGLPAAKNKRHVRLNSRAKKEDKLNLCWGTKIYDDSNELLVQKMS